MASLKKYAPSRFEDAVADLKKSVEFSGGSQMMLGALGHVYAVWGKTSEAQKVLNGLKELSTQRYVSPFSLGIIYAGIGAKEQALAWFEKAYRERSWSLFWANINPQLGNLRPEPRFQNLIGRIKLPAFTSPQGSASG